MFKEAYRRFCIFSLLILLVISAYPVVNGLRIAYISIVNGALKPEQYAKYVVPYTAICLALILFTAFQPLLLKLGRFALPAGLLISYIIFFLAELYFEGIKIHTTEMSLVDTSTLSIEELKDIPPDATVDIWQASLCIVSPSARERSVVFASRDRYYYVMANDSYKIHYYFISLILITMVCGLVYGMGRMILSGSKLKAKPLAMQGISTSLIVSLCIFANTTAFFRKAQPIQTPVASILTCMFFVALGAAVGIYAGSFLLLKKKWFGLGFPVLLSMSAVILMYIGEAAMMGGNLYRFGTGCFFAGLPVISLAPVDILVIILSGIATFLMLSRARKKENWPGKRITAVFLIICTMIAVSGIFLSFDPASAENDIYGCYEFDECIYMNPLSSFLARKESMPYVYYINEDFFITVNTKTGDTEKFEAHYEKTHVTEDEFSKLSEFIDDPFLFRIPDLSYYKERWLRAVFTHDDLQGYGLYQMDDEIWLVSLRGGRLWSIYRLVKTDKYDPADIERIAEAQDNKPEGLKRMTIRDVYDLSRLGEKLTHEDFEGFDGNEIGAGFYIMRCVYGAG